MTSNCHKIGTEGTLVWQWQTGYASHWINYKLLMKHGHKSLITKCIIHGSMRLNIHAKHHHCTWAIAKYTGVCCALCIFLHDQYLINNHGVFMQVRIQVMRKAAPPVTHPSHSTLVTDKADWCFSYSPLDQADFEGNVSTRRLAT